MTGFGEARRQANDLTVAAEVRTVNSRYFKLSLRISDGYGLLEPQIESLVRERIKRGTVQVSLIVHRTARAKTISSTPRPWKVIGSSWPSSSPSGS